MENNSNGPKVYILLETGSDLTESMKLAYAYFVKIIKLKPTCLGFQNLCRAVKKENNDLVVMDAIDGSKFEHLKNMQIRIINPLVVRYLDKEACSRPLPDIPRRTWPLRSQCMRYIYVSSADLTPSVREELQEKVLGMSGRYMWRIESITTHLVTNSVKTRKYHFAGKNKIPILRLDWINDCWDKFQYDVVRADEPTILKKYSLPIFYQLKISVSGLPTDERTKISELVEKNGGTYTPALLLTEQNSVLLLRKSEGEKYKAAKDYNIPTLRVEWLEDSIKNNYALPFTDYDIDSEPGRIEETFISGIENDPPKIPAIKPQSVPKDKSEIPTKETKKTINETLREMTAKIIFSDNRLDFLESRTIHATGFDDQTLLMIKKAVQFLGAFYYAEPKQELVTDLIVGPNISATEFQRLQEKYSGCLIRIEWLLECLKTVQLCSPLMYRVESYSQLLKPLVDNTETEPERTDVAKINSETDFLNEDDDNASQITWEPAEEPEIVNVFKRQIDSSSQDRPENFKSTKRDLENESRSSFELFDNIDDDVDDDFGDMTMEDTCPNPSATFMLSGFEEDMKANIQKKVNEHLKMVTIKQDQLITPEVTHLILENPAATEKVVASIASGIWILKPKYIDDCIESGKLLPESEYQWGIDPNILKETQVLKNRLMISAISWREQIQETGLKLFHGMTFLLINTVPKFENGYSGCANILNVGDATVYYLEEVTDVEVFRKKVLPTIDYGVVDLKDKSPPPGQKFLRIVQDLDKKLIRHEIVFKYILAGPSSTIKAASEKFSITYRDVIKSWNIR